ncbi:hypothetical protein JHW43_008015 [Diplocarpon mali]|nr:hypothetical protein JHW43_008015 [Diplocarpon mali]
MRTSISSTVMSAGSLLVLVVWYLHRQSTRGPVEASPECSVLFASLLLFSSPPPPPRFRLRPWAPRLDNRGSLAGLDDSQVAEGSRSNESVRPRQRRPKPSARSRRVLGKGAERQAQENMQHAANGTGVNVGCAVPGRRRPRQVCREQASHLPRATLNSSPAILSQDLRIAAVSAAQQVTGRRLLILAISIPSLRSVRPRSFSLARSVATTSTACRSPYTWSGSYASGVAILPDSLREKEGHLASGIASEPAASIREGGPRGERGGEPASRATQNARARRSRRTSRVRSRG